MSRCCPLVASVLRGLLGSAFLYLARNMSLRGAAADTCVAGPSGGGGGGGNRGLLAGASAACLSSSPRPNLPWLRLPEVPGAEPCKANDVLLFVPPPAPRPALPQHHVIYFPGDVQNYREVMVCHPENFQWERWCLENIAAILGHRFPSSYIWVIKCSRMHLHKYSCYDNFVASNMFGAPEHSTEYGAFKHLHALLVNAFKIAQNVLLSQKTTHSFSKDEKVTPYKSPTPTANGCPATEKEQGCERFSNSTVNFIEPSMIGGVSFTLIGFSKGCVVLNQLLYEIKEAQQDKDIDAFIKNIRAIYWLDGGHSGGSNTWVTCPDVLEGFSQTGIAINVHVTPYQVSDSMRSWNGKEHKRFVQILEELGVNVNSQLHFADEAPSLDNHFRVHEVF
uniref:mitochondrial protein C2orf69 homolog n=1 Tax=Euleptes europaea TaxID=460621 RepID=UPI002542305F|nr:mitochondrial protein C2orf69 homolog [Euleptes europaea]